jgi:hypothetical protein
VPAFRVEGRFAGITMHTWITDVGEIVRKKSPTGLLVLRETQKQTQTLAVPATVRTDLLEAAAIVPKTPRRIDDRPRSRASACIEGLTAPT